MSTPLDDARDFVASTLYATDAVIDAVTLVAAVTHALDSVRSVPRLLATGKGPEVGKSFLLKTFGLIAHGTQQGDGATEPAIRGYYAAPTRVTLVFDEIGKVFGDSGNAGSGSVIADIARRGYTHDGTITNMVNRVPVPVSCYGVVAFAGIGNRLHRDIRTRMITCVMTAKPAHEVRRDVLAVSTETLGRNVNERLHAWIQERSDTIRVAARDMPTMHAEFTNRRRQVWGSLFAVAQVAGGPWPARCLSSFRALALDTTEIPLSLAQQCLCDVTDYVRPLDVKAVSSRDVAAHLRKLGGEVYGEYSIYELSDLMTESLGKSGNARFGAEVLKAWRTADILATYDVLAAELAQDIDDDILPADPHAGDITADMFEM